MRHPILLKTLVGVLCAGAVHTPICAAAQSVQIVVTDTGFTPAVVSAVVDKPLHLHVVNRGHFVHQFSIPDYRIFSQNLQSGESTDIEFAPWLSGAHTFLSDPNDNAHGEFVGRLEIFPSPTEKSK